MTDIGVTTLAGACHSLLLRLAGRVPDGLLCQSRTWLAALEPEAMASALASHAAAARLTLAAEDVGLLGWILTGAGMDAAVLARVPVESGTDRADGIVAHVFAPAAPELMATRGGEFGPCLDLTAGSPGLLGSPRSLGSPGDAPAGLSADAPGDVPDDLSGDLSGDSAGDVADDLDRAAAAAAARIAGATALWRAWRAPSDGSPWPPPRRVFLLALNPEAEPFEATAALQGHLAALGETDPQVEAFAPDQDLPAYQRSARARSALLWISGSPEPVRLAPVYDGVTADGTPLFDLDRPRLTAADREQVAAALEAGTVLMSTTARLDDVLDPADGRGRVPSGFRTDGRWVWSDAVTYYLRTHGVAPVAGLLGHLNSLQTVPATLPDAVDLFRATAALTRPTDRSR
ncbi:hypothetical protein ABH935_008618 [Catenulispora sp. GAS73]|uniref:hypothetical protein n=1 Tax=Catenulispora sp. GAS73 TaxID=3156269 RepID=UPI003516D12F